MEFSLKLILTSLVVILTFFVQTGFSIKCWDCRSDADPLCSDPFNNETWALTDCDYWREGLGHIPGPLPTMCKKIRQRDNDVWTYIRGCGYHRESGVAGDEFCSTKTGTDNSFIEECTCKKDGCNNSSHLKVSPLLILVILSIFVFFKMD